MKKYKYELIIFLLGAIYMILELVCSRILAPFFGTSNLVWTSVIGIILLSSSVGNFLGGIIADRDSSKRNIQLILLFTGVFILLIGIIQKETLLFVANNIKDIKVGAIISTIILFFIPSMLIGFLSPILIKLKLNDLSRAGKTSGIIYALSTLGSITGTFAGGFFLIPSMGSIEILYLLSTCIFVLIFLIDLSNKNFIIVTSLLIILNISLLVSFYYTNNKNKELVLNNQIGVLADYDTTYGRVNIANITNYNGDFLRYFFIDKGAESSTFIDESKKYELSAEYTKYYDLMFNSNIDIKDTLMIGGAGYSYPKYYISHYADKNMDVVEIDDKVIELAKEYFYLDDLYQEFDLESNQRLNLIVEDGRSYLNQNSKKYDAILNDAFSGNSPATTLTTVEAVQLIHNSLNEHGVYLSNIISSVQGRDSRFLKSEVATLHKVFKNVYIVPCSNKDNMNLKQNIMVVASDDDLPIETVLLSSDNNPIVLTDNYCPVDSLIPNL